MHSDTSLNITGANRDNAHTGDIESGRAFVMEPRDIPADHPGAAHSADLYVRQGVTSEQHGEAPPPADAEYIASQSPAMIVAQVEGRVAKLEQQLAATVGFDPVSGEPVPLLKGRARENADRELAQLKLSTLPFAKIQAAEIAAAKSALPTQVDKLQAEHDKRERINARALELADEAEAKEQAERIKAQRRAQSMG